MEDGSTGTAGFERPAAPLLVVFRSGILAKELALAGLAVPAGLAAGRPVLATSAFAATGPAGIAIAPAAPRAITACRRPVFFLVLPLPEQAGVKFVAADLAFVTPHAGDRLAFQPFDRHAHRSAGEDHEVPYTEVFHNVTYLQCEEVLGLAEPLQYRIISTSGNGFGAQDPC